MRILAASEMQAGSHFAHAINVVKTAGGFTRLGHEVMLCCRPPAAGCDPSRLAGIYAEPNIKFCFAPLDAADVGPEASQRFGDWIAGKACQYGADLCYLRHYHAPLACAGADRLVAMESHAHIGFRQSTLDACLRATAYRDQPIAALITISHRLADHYIERGADPLRVHVVPDGVDAELFARPVKLPLTPYAKSGRPRAVYAGHLYESKGVPTMLEAARRLPGVDFHLIGGTDEDLAATTDVVRRWALGNVHLHGLHPHADVPRFLWHADVLLLPPSGRDPSANWTSPVKLGEYLAAGPPVIASKIPALRDWLDDRAVTFFAADDPEDLARTIVHVLSETQDIRSGRRQFAERLAHRFSYANRARSIIDAAFAANLPPRSVTICRTA